MVDEMRTTPPGRLPEDDDRRDLFPPEDPAEETPQPPAEAVSEAPAESAATPSDTAQPAEAAQENNGGAEDDARDGMTDRLERLGGEPAPAISPEEFARLQQAGQIHIDSRGRIRTTRREETEAGMSLRKRRAWYAA
jgi:hypothetical protein